MDRETMPNKDDAGQESLRSENTANPSVLGDVEDAVTPKVEGELTPWMPPGQGAGEAEEAEGT